VLRTAPGSPGHPPTPAPRTILPPLRALVRRAAMPGSTPFAPSPAAGNRSHASVLPPGRLLRSLRDPGIVRVGSNPRGRYFPSLPVCRKNRTHATEIGHKTKPGSMPREHRPCPRTLKTKPGSMPREHRPCPRTLKTKPGSMPREHRPCPRTLLKREHNFQNGKHHSTPERSDGTFLRVFSSEKPRNRRAEADLIPGCVYASVRRYACSPRVIVSPPSVQNPLTQ